MLPLCSMDSANAREYSGNQKDIQCLPSWNCARIWRVRYEWKVTQISVNPRLRRSYQRKAWELCCWHREWADIGRPDKIRIEQHSRERWECMQRPEKRDTWGMREAERSLVTAKAESRCWGLWDKVGTKRVLTVQRRRGGSGKDAAQPAWQERGK